MPDDVLELARWLVSEEGNGVYVPSMAIPLARAVLALSENRDRLDWLERRLQRQMGGNWNLFGVRLRDCDIGAYNQLAAHEATGVLFGATLRQAIDAARKEQGE